MENYSVFGILIDPSFFWIHRSSFLHRLVTSQFYAGLSFLFSMVLIIICIMFSLILSEVVLKLL